MKHKPLSRGLALAREQGASSVMLEIFRRCLLDVRRFYLYQHQHMGHGLSRRVCPLPYEEFFVADNSIADELARDREDFRLCNGNAARALDRGAVAFCVYDGAKLAHIGWIATSPAARRVLDHLGYEVDFDKREAWTGAAYTCKRWRGQGLLGHSCQRRFEYLKACGIETSRAAVAIDNIPSHHATMRFNPRVYAIGRQVKVLSFLRLWSETPVLMLTDR